MYKLIIFFLLNKIFKKTQEIRKIERIQEHREEQLKKIGI